MNLQSSSASTGRSGEMYPNSSQTESIHTQQPPANTVTSYVAAMKKAPTHVFPKKEQAIIMNVHESLRLSDYVKAIADIIGPKSIIFASRISHNRICIYLTNTELVDNLVTTYKMVQIGELSIQIRRLITPSKRIIISNVCPSIPHEVIERAIKSYRLKLVSPISFLRAGIPGADFNHIMSFRRQVYVSPPEDDGVEVPSSVVVDFDGTQYRIYLTTDNMACFLCKLNGHIANNCPNTQQSPSVASPTQLPDTPSNKRARSESSSASTANQGEKENQTLESVHEEDIMPMPPPSFPAPSKKPGDSTGACSQKAKKMKLPSNQGNPVTDKIVETVENLYLENPTPFPITPTDFKALLENTFGSRDPLMEVHRITDDVDGILKFMSDIQPHLPDRSAKSRISHLSKKIRRQLNDETFDASSTSSSVSHLSFNEGDNNREDQVSTHSLDSY